MSMVINLVAIAVKVGEVLTGFLEIVKIGCLHLVTSLVGIVVYLKKGRINTRPISENCSIGFDRNLTLSLLPVHQQIWNTFLPRKSCLSQENLRFLSS